MRLRIVTVGFIVFSVALNVNAGTLVNGKWTAPGCGVMPPAPSLDGSGVEAFNRSLKLIREWQPEAQAYISCIVKEANADTASITAAASSEQQRFHDDLAKINTESLEVKKKLDGK